MNQRPPDETTPVKRLFEGPPATPPPIDRSYAVIDGDRLDDLAARAYGIPERWWKLADTSEELDPLRVLVPGRLLPIPKGD